MSMPPELAAHPMCQLARVLTWGALGLLAYGALSWTAAQPWFALHRIEVKTPTLHVTEAQIRLVAERRVRGTFFTVDLERVQGSLEKLPWVREARVERRWPDTLVVSLVEHVPFARWNDNALLSEAGAIFAAALNQTLPKLSGPEDSSDEVLAAYRRYQTALAPLSLSISELRLSPRRAWRLRLDNGIQLALGREQADVRLARFVALYPQVFSDQLASNALPDETQAADEPVAAATRVTPLSIDLRYPDGFAVRMPNGVSPFNPSKT